MRNAFGRRAAVAKNKPLTLTNSTLVIVLATLALIGVVVWIAQFRLID